MRLSVSGTECEVVSGTEREREREWEYERERECECECGSDRECEPIHTRLEARLEASVGAAQGVEAGYPELQFHEGHLGMRGYMCVCVYVYLRVFMCIYVHVY